MKSIIIFLFAILLAQAPTANAFKRTNVGESIKEFELKNLDNQKVVLTENLGKKATLLLFWASWSPRSSEALSDFQKLYKKHGPEDLKVIAVNVDNQTRTSENAAEIAELTSTLGIEYPILIDSNLSIFDSYGVIAVPSNILTDKDGKIVALLEGYANFTRYDFRDRVLEELGILKKEEAKPIEKPIYQPKGVAARYLNMGRLLMNKKMTKRAVSAFRKSIDQDSEFPDAYLWLSKALEDEGKNEEAEKAKAKAIELQRKLAEKDESGS